jgi:ketosteroid isomerase-like protein
MTSLALLLVLAAGSQCSAGTASEPLLRIIDGDNAASVDRVMSNYSSDPVWMPPNRPPIRGTQVRNAYTRQFASEHPHLKITVSDVRAGDGVAHVTGLTEGTVEPKDGSPGRKVHDRFDAIVVCERDGWKVSVLSWGPAAN